MKRLIILLSICLCATAAKAQSAQTDTLAVKIDALTLQLSSLQSSVLSLQSTISTLEAKVNEVTAQNLALKHSISLTPTIAESKTEDGIIYRLICASGDKNTGEITLIVSALNPTLRDNTLQFSSTVTIVDTEGHQYTNYERFKNAYIGDNHVTNITKLSPNTPVEIKYKFILDNETSYLKIFEAEAYNKHNFTFRNIPIKWE